MAMRDRDGITDATLLRESAYRDTSHLDRRKALYEFTFPRFVIEDEIITLASMEDGQSILDVGCGTGKLLLKVAQQYPRSQCIGLDISEGMFARAQKQAAQYELSNVVFQKGDVQNIEFPNASFDRVVAMHMLYHASDIEKALFEIFRVVKSKGMVIATANSMHSRKKLRDLKALAAHEMGRDVFSDPNRRFNIENGPQLFKEHTPHVHLKRFDSVLRLKEQEPYMEYFDSLRSFWQPMPTDEEWKKAMLAVKKEVEAEINSTGEFTDTVGFGVIIGLKP